MCALGEFKKTGCHIDLSALDSNVVELCGKRSREQMSELS
jgi:hypothetical protein